MAQSKHTPGPWSFTAAGRVMSDRYSQPFGVVEAGKKNLICGCFGDVAGGETTAEANARLIAAAPELLEQLRIVTDDLEKVLRARGFRDDPKVLAARAIIAKAEGGAS